MSTATAHKADHKSASHKPQAPHAKPAQNGHGHKEEKEHVKADHAKKVRDAESNRAVAEEASDKARANEVALASSESNPPHSPYHEADIVAPPEKILSDLDKLSAQFRTIADDRAKVIALAETGLINVPAINPSNPTVYNLSEQEALCQRFKNATDGNEVRRICDEIDAKKK